MYTCTGTQLEWELNIQQLIKYIGKIMIKLNRYL